MKLTQFGRMLRTMRLDKGELLKDMAEKMGVSPSFLSTIEFGDKNIPESFLDKLFSMYDITENEQQKFRQEAANAVMQVKLNLKSKTDSKRTLGLSFARAFDDMTDDTVKKLMDFFDKD